MVDIIHLEEEAGKLFRRIEKKNIVCLGLSRQVCEVLSSILLFLWFTCSRLLQQYDIKPGRDESSLQSVHIVMRFVPICTGKCVYFFLCALELKCLRKGLGNQQCFNVYEPCHPK